MDDTHQKETYKFMDVPPFPTATTILFSSLEKMIMTPDMGKERPSLWFKNMVISCLPVMKFRLF